METAIWFLVSDEDKDKLKAMMPRTWQPPKSKGRVINLDCQLEDIEELGKLMAKRPHYEKGSPLRHG